MKVNTLTVENSGYPEQLRQLSDAPQILYVLGNDSLLREPYMLSVVGSRKVSSYGRQVTTSLVENVASHGIVIVSGLALGVDAIAHKAAVHTNGKTIAVMANGLDSIYPSSHRNLALQILESGGLLISEYPSGTPPMKHHFIARNRIVAALSNAVLITEASRQSGTIHTANFALDLGKPVLAVPGNITSPTSEGTNNLIRVGAIPATTNEDIFEALGLESKDRQTEIFGTNEHETLLLSLIQSGITDASELLAASKMDTKLFNQTLSMLEITRKVRAQGAGHWSL